MIFDKEHVLEIEKRHNGSCSEDFIITMVFNNMFMTEYSDWLTMEHIQEFISEHPYVYIHGHGMQELIINSERYNIAKYFIDSDRANPCAKNMYENVMNNK